MADTAAVTAAPRPDAGRGPQGNHRGGPRGGNDRRGGRRPEQAPEEKLFDERVIHIDRVARVVKGGRRFRFRALVVVGDKKGKVGIGMAKGADVTAAVSKATDVAKKALKPVNLNKAGTLPHDVQAKVGGSNILVMPASTGTGLIAGGTVRTVLEVAGVKNALSKSLGSTNKANTAYATIKALDALVPKEQWVVQPTKVAKKAAAKKEA